MTTYEPGEGFAVVGPGALVLLSADAEPRLARDVHAALVPGVGVADVLQVLTGEFATSLARIPAFALAVLTSSGVQAVVRGGFEVRVGSGAAAEVVSGAGVSTWTERFVAGADDVVLLGPGETGGGESWPVAGGIVRASAVSARSGEDVLSPGTSVPARTAEPPAPVPERTDEPAATAPETALEPVDEPAPAASLPAPAAPAAPGPGPAAPERVDEPAPVTPEPDREPAPAAERPVVEETVVPTETLLPSDEDAFDHLWGSTVLRPVEQAAVRADEPEDDVDLAPPPPRPPVQVDAPPPPAPAPAPLATPDPAPVRPAAAAEPEVASPVPHAPGAAWTPPFTLDVPGGAPDRPTSDASETAVSTPAVPSPAPLAPEAASPTPEESGPLGDHDGETVVRSSPAVVVPAPRGTPAPGAVGRVRFSTGQVVELDRSIVVGRKPRVSRVGGADVPRLVTVPSPEQDISRSHLEVRLEGVSVLVVDLGSTNGSTLLRTGQLPVRLHPLEAALVVDGDVVDLGEGVTLTFEDLA